MIRLNGRVAWSGHALTPRRWQRDALPVVIAALQRPRARGAVVQAVMGAGKSVLLTELAYLAESALSRVIVVAPKKLLVQQLAATLASRLGAASVGRYYSDAKSTTARVIVTCNNSLGSLAAALARAGDSVGLIIFDEAHRSESAGILDAVQAMAPAAVVGFSATPWRSKPSERLSLFDHVAFSYDFASAIRDGVLVPYRVVTWSDERAQETGVDSLDRDAVCFALIENADGPGIISADTVRDAEHCKEYLAARGFPVGRITGKTREAERVATIAALRAGSLRAIVHVNVLTEGADFPYLKWICLRRTGSSKVRFPQEIGRVLRTAPGKTHAVVYDPHALSVIRSLAEDADLWRPANILAYIPTDPARADKMRRWLATKDFSGIACVDEAEGFPALAQTVVERQMPRVVIWDCDTLTDGQRQWLAGAGAEWGSDKMVRVFQVIPTPADRAVVLWLDTRPGAPPDQAVALATWCARLNKIAVATLAPPPDADPLVTLASAGLSSTRGADDGEQWGALVALSLACVPPAVVGRVRGAGRRVVEVSPAPRVVDALRMPTGEAFLHEVHTALDVAGIVERRPVSVYARALPASAAQVEYLDRLKHTVRRWTKPGPPEVLDKLRPLVVDGLRGALPLGVMSDLIGVLKGLEKAGGWIFSEER